jgi:uncharacterized protein DUF3576
MVIVRAILLLVVLGGVSSCGRSAPQGQADGAAVPTVMEPAREESLETGSIWDMFNRPDPEVTVSVNKYLWNASLDVLSFLPVQSVDPFTGVIVTGFGTPPGGGRSYRAFVHITDPALDARSLKVSLQTKSGPVSRATARAVEDAILARARQIRISDSNF